MICRCHENISPAPGLSSGALERLTKSRSAWEQVERPARITASGNSGPYIDKKKKRSSSSKHLRYLFPPAGNNVSRQAYDRTAFPQMGLPLTVEKKENTSFIIFRCRGLRISCDRLRNRSTAFAVILQRHWIKLTLIRGQTISFSGVKFMRAKEMNLRHFTRIQTLRVFLDRHARDKQSKEKLICLLPTQ